MKCLHSQEVNISSDQIVLKCLGSRMFWNEHLLCPGWFEMFGMECFEMNIFSVQVDLKCLGWNVLKWTSSLSRLIWNVWDGMFWNEQVKWASPLAGMFCWLVPLTEPVIVTATKNHRASPCHIMPQRNTTLCLSTPRPPPRSPPGPPPKPHSQTPVVSHHTTRKFYHVTQRQILYKARPH